MALEPMGRDIFARVSAIHREMELILENMFVVCQGRPWTPSVDVYETADDLYVCADVPGVREEDVRVEVRSDQLIIQGERRREELPLPVRYHRAERRHGRFLARVTFDVDVDADAAELTVRDGALAVRLPKRSRG